MASQEYPLKHIRLEELHLAGFNVADFVCFAPNTLMEHREELRAFFEKHRRISCRNFHGNEKIHFKCPVLYDETQWEKVLMFCLSNNYGKNDQKTPFYTLCNEAIDPKDSVCAGNILVHDERNYFIEYFYGPGTPRDIESKGPDELRTYTRTFGRPDPDQEKPMDLVIKLAYQATKFAPLANKAYIIEFSIYPYPIGRNRTHTICWEWRWGWLHYQLQANRFLLDQLKRSNEALERAEKQIIRLQEENRRLQAPGEDPIPEMSGRSWPV